MILITCISSLLTSLVWSTVLHSNKQLFSFFPLIDIYFSSFQHLAVPHLLPHVEAGLGDMEVKLEWDVMWQTRHGSSNVSVISGRDIGEIVQVNIHWISIMNEFNEFFLSLKSNNIMVFPWYPPSPYWSPYWICTQHTTWLKSIITLCTISFIYYHHPYTHNNNNLCMHKWH